MGLFDMKSGLCLFQPQIPRCSWMLRKPAVLMVSSESLSKELNIVGGLASSDAMKSSCSLRKQFKKTSWTLSTELIFGLIV